MNLSEIDKWEDGIYQLEVTDPVVGGENGVDNIQAKQLANRTQYLKLNKQDKNATLSAFADLLIGADELIYSSVDKTFKTTKLSEFARTLLDDLDAETMRGTLGIQVALSPSFAIPNYSDGIKRAFNTIYTPTVASRIIVVLTGLYLNGLRALVDPNNSGIPSLVVGQFGDDINASTKYASLSFDVKAGQSYKIDDPFLNSGWDNMDITEYPLINI